MRNGFFFPSTFLFPLLIERRSRTERERERERERVKHLAQKKE